MWNMCPVKCMYAMLFIDRSCTRGMIHNKVHLISSGCPQPGIALQAQNRGLKHHTPTEFRHFVYIASFALYTVLLAWKTAKKSQGWKRASLKECRHETLCARHLYNILTKSSGFICIFSLVISLLCYLMYCNRCNNKHAVRKDRLAGMSAHTIYQICTPHPDISVQAACLIHTSCLVVISFISHCLYSYEPCNNTTEYPRLKISQTEGIPDWRYSRLKISQTRCSRLNIS